MRLFIAINFHEETINAIERYAAELKKDAQKANITRRDNFHITLAFIGESSRVGELKAAMDEVDAEAFMLEIDRAGRFRRDGGDTVWMSAKKNEGLGAICRQLGAALRKRGFTVDGREFEPHITLGREVLIKDFESFAAKAPKLSAEIESIELMESRRIDGRLTYSTLHSKVLNR